MSSFRPEKERCDVAHDTELKAPLPKWRLTSVSRLAHENHHHHKQLLRHRAACARAASSTQ